MSGPQPPGPWGPPPQAPGGPTPPPGPPQQPWGPPQPWQPPGPPRKGGRGKWIWGGVALVAVIAVTVVITVLVIGRHSNSPNAGPSGDGLTSGIASANDKGPVAIITDEPTCDKWMAIWNSLSDREKNGWTDRDPSVPATAWTDEQRTQYHAVAQALRTATDQALPLVKQTPHRVVRELYEAFIAYGRAYAAKVPNYMAADDHVIRVAGDSSNAMGWICNAIQWGSAGNSIPAVSAAAPPTQNALKNATLGDTANPSKFLTKPDPVCADWTNLGDDFDKQTLADWQTINGDLPVNQWPPEQKAVMDALAPKLSSFADQIEQLGRRSSNLVLQDFAVLSALYSRAYVAAFPNYTKPDGYLGNVMTSSAPAVYQACLVAGG